MHPADWRAPGDAAKYLDALAPEVYTGDPISLAELAKLPLQTRPRALLSTSMALLPGMQRRLAERFGCPVLDLYSMNEAGPVAVADEKVGGHVLVQHRLFVEILDASGQAVPPGERGEVTLTGGFNFCLPLLRYRTVDWPTYFPMQLNLRRQGPALAVDWAGGALDYSTNLVHWNAVTNAAQTWTPNPGGGMNVFRVRRDR